jgi:hypothetical protein
MALTDSATAVGAAAALVLATSRRLARGATMNSTVERRRVAYAPSAQLRSAVADREMPAARGKQEQLGVPLPAAVNSIAHG